MIVANHCEYDQRDPAPTAGTNFSDRKDVNVPKNVSAYPPTRENCDNADALTDAGDFEGAEPAESCEYRGRESRRGTRSRIFGWNV